MKRLATVLCIAFFTFLIAFIAGCSPSSGKANNPAMHTYALEGAWYLEASTTSGESSLEFSSVKDNSNMLSVDGDVATLTLGGIPVSLRVTNQSEGEKTGSYKLSSDGEATVVYASISIAEEQKRDTILLTSGYDNNVRVIGVRDDGALSEGKSAVSADLSMFSKDRTTGKTTSEMTGHDTYHKDGERNSSNNGGTTSSTSNQSGSTSLGKKNALEKARSYLDLTAFSRTGLIEQLKYEGFTNDEATYAVDNCGANWKEQAARKAKEYLDLTSFSRSGLIEQLEYEGFTREQAEYGARAVGY